MNVTIITDASYCSETRAAGYGYWIAAERGKVGGGGPIKGDVVSSGAAEMLAVCNALFVGLHRELVRRGDNVLIQTDCISAIQAFKGSRTPTTAQEKEAVRFLLDLQDEHYLTLSYRHVKGHTNRTEARYVTNHLCDKRARLGMRAAREVRQGNGHGS